MELGTSVTLVPPTTDAAALLAFFEKLGCSRLSDSTVALGAGVALRSGSPGAPFTLAYAGTDFSSLAARHIVPTIHDDGRAHLMTPFGLWFELSAFAADHPPASHSPSLLGEFAALALPVADLIQAVEYFAPFGFTQFDTAQEPNAHLARISDGLLMLALSQGDAVTAPCLLFAAGDLPARLAKLQTLGITSCTDGPDLRLTAPGGLQLAVSSPLPLATTI